MYLTTLSSTLRRLHRKASTAPSSSTLDLDLFVNLYRPPSVPRFPFGQSILLVLFPPFRFVLISSPSRRIPFLRFLPYEPRFPARDRVDTSCESPTSKESSQVIKCPRNLRPRVERLDCSKISLRVVNEFLVLGICERAENHVSLSFVLRSDV